MAKKIKEIDITKTGPQSFRQLQNINNDEFISKDVAEAEDFISKREQRAQSFTLYDPYRQAEQNVSSPLSGTTAFWGASMFDEENATEEQFQRLGDIRAENQPWYAKISAGVGKGVILTGTTFLDGTIGLLFGGAKAIEEGRWSALWDNDFSKAMQTINEYSEEIMPNYYTEAEMEGSMSDRIFSANFIGDKFIKNLGFTVGAFLSGAVVSGGVGLASKGIMAGAKGLGSSIGAIKNIANTSSLVASGIGAVTSAVNEGRIEALNNSKDWFTLQKAKLDDSHNSMVQAIENTYKGTEMYDILMANEFENYNKALTKIEEDRLKMGNADLLMNIPILTASNIIQFGKLYANGFKTAKKASNIIGRAGEAATTMTTTKGIMKGALNALSEGVEEISQKAASTAAGLYYETDVNNFYKAQMDPEAEQEQLNWIKSVAKGINETINDKSSWEEFIVGTLTGALGMPTFGSANTQKSTYLGRNKAIGLSGGIIGEFREYKQQMQREQAIVDYLNNRVQSPEFLNYYRGLIRHKKFQNDMDRAVQEGDEFSFKNSEYNQMVSDIIMFDNADRLEELKTLINSAYDTTDENLESIIKNTTAIDSKGALIGPYAQYATKDKEGNIVPNLASEESKQEMIKKFTEAKDEIMSTIKDYSTAKTEVELLVGDRVDDEQLKELTWLNLATNNLNDRKEAIYNELKTPLSKSIPFYTARRDLARKSKEQHANDYNVSEDYKKYEKAEKENQQLIDVIENFINNDAYTITEDLSRNPKKIELLKEKVKESPYSSTTEVSEFNKKIDDLIKINKMSLKYKDKLEEYTKNPEKQVEEKAKAKEEVIKNKNAVQQSSIVERFNWNSPTSQIAKTLEENKADIESSGGIVAFMKALTPEQSKKIRKARKFQNTINTLKNSLNDSDLTDRQKRIVASLVDESANDIENIEELSAKINETLEDKVKDTITSELSRVEEGINDLEIESAIAEAEAAIKEFFDKNIEKAALSASEAERIRDLKEQEEEEKRQEIAKKLAVEEEKQKAEEPESNPSLEKKDRDDIEFIKDYTDPTTPEDLKKVPKKDVPPTRPKGKAGKTYNYRPQLSELYMHASNMETYLSFIEKHPDAIPEGVDPEAFKTYIREVHSYLKNQGTFTFVNGTNSNWKLELGDSITFKYNKELSDKAGVDVVEMVVEKDGKTQVVGTLPTSLDFNSKPKYAKTDDLGIPILEEDNWVWETSDTTVGETRPEQKALYEYIIKESSAENSKPITTKVTSLHGGRIAFSDVERKVSDIYGETVPIIAVINENASLSTENTDIDNTLMNAINGKPWQVYVMVPSNNGMYHPALCVSTPLSLLLANENDWYIQQTIKALQVIPTKITDIKDNIREFYRWLNIPGLAIRIGKQEKTWKDSDPVDATHMRIVFSNPSDPNGEPSFFFVPITEGKISNEEALVAIRNMVNTYNREAAKVKKRELTTNVNIKKLTNSSEHVEYRKNISNYLTTNIADDPHTHNDWFLYEPTLVEKEVTRAIKANSSKPKEVVPHNHNASKTVIYEGNQYNIDKDGAVTDSNGNLITDDLRSKVLTHSTKEGKIEIEIISSEPIFEGSGRDLNAIIGTNAGIEGLGVSSNVASSIASRKRRPPRNLEMSTEVDLEPKASKDSIDKDMELIKKMFPALGEQGRITVVNNLKSISRLGNAVEVYGHFRDGILYINSNSPRGTAFHEAFHYVTEALLTEEEKTRMFKEAITRYGQMEELALEENLAEDFRDFMNGFNDTSLLGKIKSLFRNLKFLIKELTGNINYLDNLFYSMYRGSYSNRTEDLEDSFALDLLRYKNKKVAYSYLSEDIQRSLASRGISREDYENLTVTDKENTIFCLI